jgi:tight adherence protein B
MIPATLTATLILVIGVRLRWAPRARRPAARPDDPVSGVVPPGARRARCAEPAPVAEWCDGLAGAIRTGSTLAAAIRATDPPASCRTELDTIILRLERGSSVADAIGEAIGRRGADDHLDLALTVIRACAEQGGGAAEPLDRVAAALRGRAADRADRRVQSASARMSALVMTLLPAAMLLILLLTSRSVRLVARQPSGLAMLAVGAVVNLIGWWWISRVIDRGLR